MRILVCVKRVPLTGGRMVLTADEQELETRHLGFTISPHEECGVEEAVRLVEHMAERSQCWRWVLPRPRSRSATDRHRRRPRHPARHRRRGVGPPGHRGGDRGGRQGRGRFDLIVFGNESADSGDYQVGIRVAHALGRPVVTGLKGLSVEDGWPAASRSGRRARRVPACRCPPWSRCSRASTCRATRRCRPSCAPGRSRSTTSTPERPEARLKKLRLVVPPGQGKQAEILGEGAEAAPAVVNVMRELGVA